MPRQKSYNLLCPIARALDAVGDRWSLLILRDLHAGPARFADLQSGLDGIASNLLSDRLTHLTNEGLIEKTSGNFGKSAYQLTQTGRGTREILFSLARLGGAMEPVPAPKKPGNLRTIAVTLAAAMDQVIDDNTEIQAQLTVDNEPFQIVVRDGEAEVTVGSLADQTVHMITTYPSLLAVSAGKISVEEFAANHTTTTAKSSEELDAFLQVMGEAMAKIQ